MAFTCIGGVLAFLNDAARLHFEVADEDQMRVCRSPEIASGGDLSCLDTVQVKSYHVGSCMSTGSMASVLARNNVRVRNVRNVQNMFGPR